LKELKESYEKTQKKWKDRLIVLVKDVLKKATLQPVMT